MSKLASALIDPTTADGQAAARAFMHERLLGLRDTPGLVRRLVGRSKMHEFFGLYRPGRVRGAHWHTVQEGLFVRYQHYRQAEAIFEECRDELYPESTSA